MITFANLKIFCSRLLKHFHESKLISSRLLTEEFFFTEQMGSGQQSLYGNICNHQSGSFPGICYPRITMNSSLAAVS